MTTAISDTAKLIAEHLLQVKAIKLQPNDPFTWASGIRSPIYCDTRLILSFPKIRTHIRHEIVNRILDEYERPDMIAGVATGAIAHGALVAEEMGLPFVYVRSVNKKHGLKKPVEGIIEKGRATVVLEDLVSTGTSSLNVVNTLREAGCQVKGMMAIFTYNLDISKENFKKAKCKLVTLCDYDTLIEQALETGYITRPQLKVLKKWREDPQGWEG